MTTFAFTSRCALQRPGGGSILLSTTSGRKCVRAQGRCVHVEGCVWGGAPCCWTSDGCDCLLRTLLMVYITSISSLTMWAALCRRSPGHAVSSQLLEHPMCRPSAPAHGVFPSAHDVFRCCILPQAHLRARCAVQHQSCGASAVRIEIVQDPYSSTRRRTCTEHQAEDICCGVAGVPSCRAACAGRSGRWSPCPVVLQRRPRRAIRTVYSATHAQVSDIESSTLAPARQTCKTFASPTVTSWV